MSAAAEGRLKQIITVIVGVTLAVVQLPAVVAPFRPDFLLLFVLYWCLSAPQISGLTFAWFCGLLMDVHQGTVLGQHAFGFLAAAYIMHRNQLRLRIRPVWQQAFTVFVLLALYRFWIYWIDGITSQADASWTRWAPVFTGTLLWPLIVGVMDSWNRRRG
jgi:rod shape-determining protein MreD